MSEVADDGEVDGRTFFVYDGDTADEEYLVGALEILPAAAGEAAEVFEVIFVCSLEGRTLVATVQAAWHRRAAQRRLPPGALVRATAVEVAAASRTSRAELAPDARIKVAGLPRARPFGGHSFRHASSQPCDGYLPLGEALVEVAKDKFQFETAESGEPSRREARQPGCPPWRCQTCSPRTRPGA